MNDKVNETVMDEEENEEQLELDQAAEFDPYKEYEQDERGRLIVPLKHSITVKSKNSGTHTVEQVILRHPLGADLRASGAAKNDQDAGLIMLERCGEGLTKEIINKMRLSDLNECSKVVNFLGQE